MTSPSSLAISPLNRFPSNPMTVYSSGPSVMAASFRSRAPMSIPDRGEDRRGSASPMLAQVSSNPRSVRRNSPNAGDRATGTPRRWPPKSRGLEMTRSLPLPTPLRWRDPRAGDRVHAGAPGDPYPPAGAPEHRGDHARRRRVRCAGHVRRPGADADAGSGRQRGPALQPVPHHWRCARRRAPRCSPGATTTAPTWARIVGDRLRISRLRRGHPAEHGHRGGDPAPATATAPPCSARPTSPRCGRPSPAGPFDRWPTGLGFDRFYGFLGGEASQWEPALLRPDHPGRTPRRP